MSLAFTADASCGRTRRVEAPGFVLSEFAYSGAHESTEHAHVLHGLVLPLAGAVRLAEGTAAAVVGFGEALLLPGGLAHCERADAQVVCLLLELTAGAPADSPGLFDRLARVRHADLGAAAVRLGRRLRAHPSWEHEYDAVEMVLLVDHARMRLVAGREPAPGWMTHAAERLREEFRAPPALGEVARDAGVSREHLARQFRRTTGVPAGEFVRRRRVLEAMRLLRDSSLTIAAVAAATGFSDQSHLTRHLRHYLGVTPSGVRQCPA